MQHLWFELEDRAWAASPETRPRWKRWGFDAVRTLSVAFGGIGAHGVTDRAHALAMVTAIGLVPMLATVFSVSKAVGLGAQLEPVLYQAFGVVPESHDGAAEGPAVVDVVDKILGVVQEADATRLGVVGVSLTIVAVVLTLGRVERALNKTWGIDRPRTFARKFSDYLSVTLTVPLLLVGATTLGATHTLSEMMPEEGANWMMPLLDLTPDLGPVVLAFFAFTFLYVFLPNTRVPLASALVGGAFATVSWALLQKGWLTVQVHASRVGTIYGTFAAIPLLLTFLIIFWGIVLCGGELAHGFQRRRLRRPKPESGPPSASARLRLELAALIHGSVQQARGEAPPTVEELADALEAGEGTAEETVASLVGAGWLRRLQEGERDVYVPAWPIGSMRLGSVVAGLIRGPKRAVEQVDGPPSELLPLDAAQRSIDEASASIPAHLRGSELDAGKLET